MLRHRGCWKRTEHYKSIFRRLVPPCPAGHHTQDKSMQQSMVQDITWAHAPLPARLKSAPDCNMTCWVCIWSALGALEEIPESLLPSTQTYLQLKAMGRTDMEDHDTSHHYMYSFHIAAALFPVMEAIK